MTTAGADARGTTHNGAAPASPDVTRRLGELRDELRAGRERLLELEAEAQRVRDTVLRIEGAIMALEEFDEPRAAAPE